MDAQALGRYLRETREAKEITLDEAEHALRIRRRILESFEAGEFNLPEIAAIQVRGFMRNYARFLGLDEDRIVAYYEEALVETSSRSLSGRAGSRKRKDKRDSQSMPVPVAPRSVTDTPPSLPPVQVPAPAQVSMSGEPKRRRGGGLLTLLFRLVVAGAALAVIAYVVIQLVQTDGGEPGVPNAENGIFGELPDTPTSTIQPT
ncbi:MAG: helix-turn-helix domain-containing protein, partial [Anaerolineae bacterium]|nr:helix-turn-helix domain-containing protein [Anaerolineae bacterium]